MSTWMKPDADSVLAAIFGMALFLLGMGVAVALS